MLAHNKGITQFIATIGKDATLFVSAGDAFDYRSNKLSDAFIMGKQVILDSKQQDLYDRFSKKYGHKK